MYCIAANGHAEITVQRSRFIGAIARVDTETDARAFIAQCRKTHHAARHHATAWILGDAGDHRRSNDDGEPAGTAGAPILSVLAGRELRDTVAVVTRYFGGSKLGTGGLARAYGSAISAAVETVTFVQPRRMHTVTVTCGHAAAGRLDADLRGSGYTITGSRYDQHVHIDAVVDDIDTFAAWLAAGGSGASITTTTATVIDT